MHKVIASHVLKGGKMILRTVKPQNDGMGVKMAGIDRNKTTND